MHVIFQDIKSLIIDIISKASTITAAENFGLLLINVIYWSVVVRSSAWDIIGLGRKGKQLRKIKRSLSVKDRIFMIGFISLSKKAVGFQKVFVVVNAIYIIYCIVEMPLVLLSFWLNQIISIAYFVNIFIIAFVTIPFVIFSIINAWPFHRGKWRYEKPNGK